MNASMTLTQEMALRKEPPEIGFLKDDARRAGAGEQK